MKRAAQRGITLVVSLVMLIVLTLLVVSAIRFGNINLRIAGNAQTEAEAAAATQVVVEKTVALINGASRPDDVAAQLQVAVSTGGADYKVDVTKPACALSKNVVTTELDPSTPADRACYEGEPTDPIFDAGGNPVPQPTACKDQQWEFSAALNDAPTGAKVTMLQGLALRVGSEVACP
jgi:hypothetical protein